MTTCVHPNCDSTSLHARGLCKKHHQHHWARGSLDMFERPRRTGPRPTAPRVRFERYVAKQPNGCWLWTASLDKKGYGKATVNGGGWKLAHRVAWELYRGEIPDGLCACHACDTPACVNPEHLFIGTQQDNVDDMARKGRGHWTRRA